MADVWAALAKLQMKSVINLGGTIALSSCFVRFYGVLKKFSS